MKISTLLTALIIALIPTLSVSAQDKGLNDITVGFVCAQVIPCVAPDFNVEPIFLSGPCADPYIKVCANEKAVFLKLKADRKKALRKERAKKAKAKRTR